MPTKEVEKRWPQITEKTSEQDRSDGVRSFEIQGKQTSWSVKGMRGKVGIVFKLEGYSNYLFTLKSGVVSGKKARVERKSDSGNLSCHEGRFNLIDDHKVRRTVRMSGLVEYLPEAFECL